MVEAAQAAPQARAVAVTHRDAHEERALAWARGGAIAAFIGAFAWPPIANWSLALLLIGFVRLPSARARLRAVLQEPLPRAALLLLAVMAVATTWSSAPWMERFSHLWGWRTLLFMILCLAVFDSREWKVRLVLGAVPVALIASAAAWTTWALDYQVFPIHPAGTVLRNGVTQGLAFAVCAYLAVVVALNERWLDYRLRLSLLAAAGLLVINLLFVTAGRSAQVGMVIMASVTALALLRGRARVAVLIAVPVVFVLGVLIAPMAKERFARGWHELTNEVSLERVTSVGMRAVTWRISARMIEERPLLGYGTGGFASEYAARAKQSQTGWRATVVEDPHSQYLSIQLQAGVIGTLAFAWFLLAAVRQRTPLPYRVCAVALLASWAATSLVSSHFETFNEGHMIALLLGCLLAKENDQPASLVSTAARTSS
jgi:O-antigen ligase